MSDYESKLERFQRFVEEQARKGKAGQESGQKPRPVQPSPEPQPTAARIGPPLAEATGSVSQVDKSAVLTSSRPETRPEPLTADSTGPLPVEEEAGEENIPEVEDYLPWLKEEDTPKPVTPEKPAVPKQELSSDSAVVEGPAAPAPEPSETAPPAPESTPRSYAPPSSISSRDRILSFEGTGEPRPLLREADTNTGAASSAERETRDEETLELDLEVQPKPTVEADVQPEQKPHSDVRASTPEPMRPMRVKLKQPPSPPDDPSLQEVRDMWARLPHHIQLLMGTQVKEVAQNSYKISFRESREELIQRLLDPALSLEEAARILNVCPTTVRRYTNRGVLRHFRTVGNQRRFRLSDVLAFLETLAEGKETPEEAKEVKS